MEPARGLTLRPSVELSAYALTKAGRKQLEREQADWRRMSEIMARLLGAAPGGGRQ